MPLLGLALLLAAPSTDVHWEHHPSHFWLVLAAAVLSGALAYATGVSARRRDDARVYLVSLAFVAASGFLALHALATPGVLLEKGNLGFAISTPIGLVLASAFAAVSAHGTSLRTAAALERALLLALAVWALVSLLWLPGIEDVAVPERLSAEFVVLAVVAIALYAFAVLRYALLYRERGSTLVLAFAAAFTLLAEAMVAVAASRNWHASWWEWHVLMLAAFALVAVAAHREWHQERFSGLYLDETAGATRRVSVLFADLAGFTSYSEGRDAGEVNEMLNAYFAAVIPAVERNDGRVDRLVGDAIFATFEGDGHERRAARAALELQDAAGAVAARNPTWPRFRAGVNSGEASVGVLGSGSGRTYSVVGDTVNLGSRIEGLAPPGAVALGAETAAALEDAETEPLGTVQVKGRQEPVAVVLLRRL